MRKCPKCSSHFNDEPKICRVCGAILEPLTDATASRAGAPGSSGETTAELTAGDPADPDGDSDSESGDPVSAGAADWTCSACTSSVPASFDICWKCGADRSGVVDAGFTAPPVADDTDEAIAVAADEDESAPPPRPCPQCGSHQIIPQAQILDQGRQSDGLGYAMVDAHPEALIFKDRRYGRLIASICGQCGHVELRVENARRLYEHWQRAQE